MRVALEIAARAFVLDNGRIVYSGSGIRGVSRLWLVRRPRIGIWTRCCRHRMGLGMR